MTSRRSPEKHVQPTTSSQLVQAQSSRLAGISARCLGIALMLALSMSGWPTPTASSLAFLSAVLLLLFDRRHPLSLRNFFVVYTVALFGFGVTVFRLPGSLYADMCLYLSAFVLGYILSSVRNARPSSSTTSTEIARTSSSLSRISTLEELILVLAFLNVLLLAYRVSAYGLSAFYSGQALLDQVGSYGNPSVTGGLLQIVVFVLKFSSIAAVILYAQTSIQAAVKLRYRFPILLLVVIPIASLARSDALIGTFFLLAIHAVERRVAVSKPSPLLPPAGSVRASATRPRRRRGFGLVLLMVTSLFAGLVIGGLRQGGPTRTTSTPFERSLPLLQSEFTPIQAYSEIIANDEALGRTYGSTIIFPMVLKIVPRGLYPGKPQNSGARYMSILRPLEFAAGYALPPTLFGDAYMNFGTVGAMLACLLVGAVAARLDRAYKYGRLRQLPWFLIAFVSFYGLLRNALSESLSGILLTLAAWFIIGRAVGVRRSRPSLPGTGRELDPGVPLATPAPR